MNPSDATRNFMTNLEQTISHTTNTNFAQKTTTHHSILFYQQGNGWAIIYQKLRVFCPFSIYKFLFVSVPLLVISKVIPSISNSDKCHAKSVQYATSFFNSFKQLEILFSNTIDLFRKNYFTLFFNILHKCFLS